MITVRRYEVFLLHKFTSRDSGSPVTERRTCGRFFTMRGAEKRMKALTFLDRCGGGYTLVKITDHRTGDTWLERVL